MAYAYSEKQKALNGYVYFMVDGDHGHWKIGRAMDPFKRLKEVQTGCAGELTVYAVMPSRNPARLEQFLHRRFKHLRLQGEWFAGSDREVAQFADEYGYDMTVPGVPHARLWEAYGEPGPPPKLKVR